MFKRLKTKQLLTLWSGQLYIMEMFTQRYVLTVSPNQMLKQLLMLPPESAGHSHASVTMIAGEAKNFKFMQLHGLLYKKNNTNLKILIYYKIYHR